MIFLYKRMHCKMTSKKQGNSQIIFFYTICRKFRVKSFVYLHNQCTIFIIFYIFHFIYVYYISCLFTFLGGAYNDGKTSPSTYRSPIFVNFEVFLHNSWSVIINLLELFWMGQRNWLGNTWSGTGCLAILA